MKPLTSNRHLQELTSQKASLAGAHTLFGFVDTDLLPGTPGSFGSSSIRPLLENGVDNNTEAVSFSAGKGSGPGVTFDWSQGPLGYVFHTRNKTESFSPLQHMIGTFVAYDFSNSIQFDLNIHTVMTPVSGVVEGVDLSPFGTEVGSWYTLSPVNCSLYSFRLDTDAISALVPPAGYFLDFFGIGRVSD